MRATITFNTTPIHNAANHQPTSIHSPQQLRHHPPQQKHIRCHQLQKRRAYIQTKTNNSPQAHKTKSKKPPTSSRWKRPIRLLKLPKQRLPREFKRTRQPSPNRPRFHHYNIKSIRQPKNPRSQRRKRPTTRQPHAVSH